MTSKFKCFQCGQCCVIKYPCIYSFELDKAKRLATELDVELGITPFRFKFDLTNKNIIILIYRFNKRPCIFMQNNKCMIQKDKFIACRKYPIATWLDLGFLSLLGFHQTYFDFDRTCTFLKSQEYEIDALIKEPLEEIFPSELRASKEDRDTWISMEKNLRRIAKNQKFKLISDIKMKKKNKFLYEKNLKEWNQLSFEQYIKKYDNL